MSYRIAQCAAFMSDLVAAPRSIQKKCLKEVIPTLEESPDIQRGKKTKKLKGYTNLWRYALTDPEYRIIYEIDRDNQTVKLRMMGPRKDNIIYDRLHYIPGEGPSKVTIEVVPDIEPQYIGENPDVLDLAPPEPTEGQAEPLPTLIEEQLKQWRVEETLWQAILNCRTEDELLNADIPQHVKLRVMDCLWPRPIEQVVSQPTYVVNEEHDFGKVKDGQLSRLLLNLDREQRAAIDRRRQWPILIKGGPGTGKSIVALYKAASLIQSDQQELFRPPHVLFTTYTNSLINASRELFDAYLDNDADRLQIRTVNSIAAVICRMNDCELDFVQDNEAFIGKALSALRPEDRKSLLQFTDSHYLLEEIEWVIEGWALEKQQEYLDIARPGRKTALNEQQRKLVWALYKEYRAKLNEQKKNTYEEAQARALGFVKKQTRSKDGGDAKSWTFDYVFIDEAQDLKPVGLRLCAALCRNAANVCLTADMNQAIYGKGVSWNSVVESLRFTGNRTTNLKKNYRSTDQIIRGADDLVRDLDDIDSETVYTEPVHTGPKPEFRRFSSTDDQNAAIVQWIQGNLRALRLPLGCAAILCNTRKAVDNMTRALGSKGLPSVQYSDGRKLDAPKVKIMPIHGSKGLEFPLVVIPDFRSEAFGWLEPGDSEAQVVAARKLYFVACTRAMKRLMVCVVGNQQDALHKLIDIENWET